MDNQRLKVQTAVLSVASNASLVVLKIIVGVAIGSVSVISEAIHSAVDLLAALIAWFAVRTSDKPADEEHPYGHGKIENVSGTVEAVLIFFAAAWIIFEAVKKFSNPEPIKEGWIGVGVMGFSAAVNLAVSARLFKVGKLTDSIALQADGWHLRTDVYTSMGVLVGLAIIMVGKLVAPDVNLAWVDPVAAIAVALLIIKAAWDLTKQSFRDILDAGLPLHEIKVISDVMDSHKDKLFGYHDLRTRKAGSKRFVELHLEIHPDVTVSESHAVSEEVRASIEAQLPGVSVHIHVDPADTEAKKV